jgi:hypothetical protein
MTMDKRTGPKKMAFLAVAALAMVLAVNAPSQAADVGGHGFGGGHPGGAVVHHGFDRQHFDRQHFDGRHFDGRHFDRGVHGRLGFGFVPVLPYYGYDPYYSYDQSPGYWYYCPSYGAYYPNVATCPEPWVPIPTS